MSIQNYMTQKYGQFKAVNYLVGNYHDLQDVVKTISSIIENNAEKSDQGHIYRLCQITTLPLKSDSTGFVLKVKLPEKILVNAK